MTATFPSSIPPEVLRTQALRQRDQFQQASVGQCLGRDVTLELDAELLLRLFACSEFIALTCIRHPRRVAELLDSGDLHAIYAADTLSVHVKYALGEVLNEPQLSQSLRRLRSREMLRIAWRDIAGLADLNETLCDLSRLADACIDAALAILEGFARALWGTPVNAHGELQRLAVIAMGKLGANELNFSSDVDLIFTYPEEGETQGGPRQISNSEYFIRLCQQLFNVLNQNTADGFVFRIDARLRPFGDSGALALSFDALEQYYQVHGREWERYAMVKARPCAGDRVAGERLLTTLMPFVYRRYLDFGAFESLREMKRLIVQEVARKGRAENIKLGSGGIREIEFIGQAFQLIRGGRQPQLRERQIQKVLAHLGDVNYLPPYVVQELLNAYMFLRHSEHRLQEYGDSQTHLLPSDDVGRTRLAYAMGFNTWLEYEIALNKHRQHVHEHFDQVFAAPQAEVTVDASADLAGVWSCSLPDDIAQHLLLDAGYAVPEEAQEALLRLQRSGAFRGLSNTGRQRMDQLIPLMLGAVGKTSAAVQTLTRVLRLVETIARRTAYLSLLVENPMALSQLVKLCSASAWIAELLSRHPLLLDELLDPRTLYTPPKMQALRSELAQRLEAIAPDDLEQQMEALRQFKQANVLHVAAADLADALPLMVVSDHLSWIAETVITAALNLAWNELTARHGAPPLPPGEGWGEGVSSSLPLSTVLTPALSATAPGVALPPASMQSSRREREQGFAVIAYGKLGGLELGYGSDLDLVFLYASADPEQLTPGVKPISSAVFFTRLAQRIVHIFTAHTPSGVLYDVDLRLRPSGASGLLVSTVDAYAEYQSSAAWTWEHQALVRARPVAGHGEVLQRFAAIRREVLTRIRDLDLLRGEVRAMREKMRATFASPGKGKFDLKQGHGGIVDIEFLVQYGVLAWAREHAPLLDFTDNIRLLDTLGKAGKLIPEEVNMLCNAYRSYRARQHKMALQNELAVVDQSEFTESRAAVVAAWRKLLVP